MTNDMDNTFQDLASACQEIERLKADNRALESELARVFDALGISNPPNSKPLPTHEHVARLKSENARLAAALVHIHEYWNGAQNEAAMYDACKHIQEFASAASGGGAVLSDLLAPTIELEERAEAIATGHLQICQCEKCQFVRELGQDASRLRAECGEKP